MPSYGCRRQVYHPLSERAEPTALLYYESSDDEDPVGEYGNLPWQAREQDAVMHIEFEAEEVEAKEVETKVEPEVEVNVEADVGGKATATISEVTETAQAATPERPQTPPITPKAVESSQCGLLRPENTFGESSPFKRSSNSKGREYGRGREKDKVEGKGKERVEEQELEGWEWEKQRYKIPGAFDSE